MAEDPAFFTVAPWGYRVLSPLLVHAFVLGDVVRGLPPLEPPWPRPLRPPAVPLPARGGRAPGCPPHHGALLLLPARGRGVPQLLPGRAGGAAPPLVALLALRSRLAPPPCPRLGRRPGPGRPDQGRLPRLAPGLVATACASLGLRAGLLRAFSRRARRRAVHLALRRVWAPYPAAPGPACRERALVTAGGRILAAARWWASSLRVRHAAGGVAPAPARRPRLLPRYGLCWRWPWPCPSRPASTRARSSPPTTSTPTTCPGSWPTRCRSPRPGPSVFPRRDPGAAPAGPRRRARAGEGRGGPRLVGGSRLWCRARGPLSASTVPPRRPPRPHRRPFVLAFSRDSLAFARRLEAGRPVMYEPVARRFLPGRSDPRHMERMRWFLREGFGERPEYGMEEVAFFGDRVAGRVVPWARCPGSSFCGARAPSAMPRPSAANWTPLGADRDAPSPRRERLTVPAQALFRGDNRLAFEYPGSLAPGRPPRAERPRGAVRPPFVVKRPGGPGVTRLTRSPPPVGARRTVPSSVLLSAALGGGDGVFRSRPAARDDARRRARTSPT